MRNFPPLSDAPTGRTLFEVDGCPWVHVVQVGLKIPRNDTYTRGAMAHKRILGDAYDRLICGVRDKPDDSLAIFRGYMRPWRDTRVLYVRAVTHLGTCGQRGEAS
jgi:hypothetical protein